MARSIAPQSPSGTPSGPRIGLALGGGGARGLAHIAVLEAFDDLGVKPAVIAGTSIGAIIGAAYAAGIPARELRAEALRQFRDRAQTLARVLRARVGRFAHLARGLANPVLVDGERLLDLFWPETVPDRFEDLGVPFLAVATDYYARTEVVISEGPLVTAVAGSMAIPGLVRPVHAGERILVDGGAVDPLPFDHLFGRADAVVAVDVTGGPVPNTRGMPAPFEAMLGASQIMQNAIVAQKLKARAPDLLLRPPVEGFRALEFFKAKAILAAADTAKDDVKRALDALLVPPLSAGREKKS